MIRYNHIILLMDEILNNRRVCIKPCKQWDKLPINWCRILSINSITTIQPQWFHFSEPWKLYWVVVGFNDFLCIFESRSLGDSGTNLTTLHIFSNGLKLNPTNWIIYIYT